MRTNYAFFLIFLFASSVAFSQVNLTQPANEPANGDVVTFKFYNFGTVNIVPTNVGANQVWDFSNHTLSTDPEETHSYTNSIANGSTLSRNISNSFGLLSTAYYKSTAGQFELVHETFPVGSSQPDNRAYPNSKIQYKWPLTFGSTYIDTFSNTMTNSSIGTHNFFGTIKVSATGTGTLIIPGGPQYTVIQITTTEIYTITVDNAPVTPATTLITYEYFESGTKFPLLIAPTNPNVNIGTILVNKSIAVGLTENLSSNSLSVYPNPVKDRLYFHDLSPELTNLHYSILTVTGQVVEQGELLFDSVNNFHTVPTSNLLPDAYILRLDNASQKKCVKFIKIN